MLKQLSSKCAVSFALLMSLPRQYTTTTPGPKIRALEDLTSLVPVVILKLSLEMTKMTKMLMMITYPRRTPKKNLIALENGAVPPCTLCTMCPLQ